MLSFPVITSGVGPGAGFLGHLSKDGKYFIRQVPVTAHQGSLFGVSVIIITTALILIIYFYKVLFKVNITLIRKGSVTTLRFAVVILFVNG